MNTISIRALIIIIIFSIGYMFLLMRKTASRQLDFYDLVMLSMVALVPLIFVLFPTLSYWIAAISGVEFPFVLMFGILFAALFMFIHRLTIKIHQLELDRRLLVQELSLLQQSTDQSCDKK